MPSFNRPIYLDYAATTPVDPRVVQAMVPWLAGAFGIFLMRQFFL